jgi:hypothetical protein
MILGLINYRIELKKFTPAVQQIFGQEDEEE